MTFAQAQVQRLSAQVFEAANETSEIYFGEDVRTVASAATPVEYAVPLQRKDTVFLVALGINSTVPALLNARAGMRVTFVFAATGVYTVTWNAAFKYTANGAAANAQYGATSFVYNGTYWVQEAGALAYK
jgi:plastocyanin